MCSQLIVHFTCNEVSFTLRQTEKKFCDRIDFLGSLEASIDRSEFCVEEHLIYFETNGKGHFVATEFLRRKDGYKQSEFIPPCTEAYHGQ